MFYTSYVEGSQISIQAAMDFLTSDLPPRDIEEQMIANNRQASNYASSNLYRPIDAEYLKELVYLLTDGMDQGGQDYRSTILSIYYTIFLGRFCVCYGGYDTPS